MRLESTLFSSDISSCSTPELDRQTTPVSKLAPVKATVTNWDMTG